MGKTSSAVKQRYNEKTYSQIAVRLPKDLVSEWERHLQSDGLTKAGFIRNAITEYLKAGE